MSTTNAAAIARNLAGQEWEVFARSKRGDFLTQIGTVRAPSERLAKAYALMTYDEETWAEIAVVPRSSFVWARRVKGLFGKEGQPV